MARRRAMTTERASYVKLQGHRDAKEFAKLIGLPDDYDNDAKAKKDVIDQNGDAHSVKSGEKKWQIFLYSAHRIETDYGFKFLNGIGDLLVACIRSFPATFEQYQQCKQTAKEALREHMRALAEQLKRPKRLEAFIYKAMFNGGEVNYLTVKHGGHFHVFWAEEVVEALAKVLHVENSQARQAGQTAEQKVVFKTARTVGEIEMRNDSEVHYREIKFWLKKPDTLAILQSSIGPVEVWGSSVHVYGTALKKFRKRHKDYIVGS